MPADTSPKSRSLNPTLFVAYRGLSRAMLHAPYVMFYLTEQRGLSAMEWSGLLSLYYGTTVVAEVPSGVVADRLGRKLTMMLGTGIGATYPLLLVFGDGFFDFALGHIGMALAVALISGADSALLYDSLVAERRESEYARFEGAGTASWLGVSAAGFIFADMFLVIDGDPSAVFFGTSILSLLALASAAFMREPSRSRSRSSADITRSALRDVRSVAGLARLLVYSLGLFLWLRAAIQLFFNPILVDGGIAVNHFGSILAVVNLIGAVAAWRAHTLTARLGERFVFVAMPLAMVVMYGLLLLPLGPGGAALFCIQGAVLGLQPALVRNRLNELVPDSGRRATLLSIESLGCRLAFAPAALAIGWGLDRGNIQHAILITLVVGGAPFLLLPFFRARTIEST